MKNTNKITMALMLISFVSFEVKAVRPTMRPATRLSNPTITVDCSQNPEALMREQRRLNRHLRNVALEREQHLKMLEDEASLQHQDYVPEECIQIEPIPAYIQDEDAYYQDWADTHYQTKPTLLNKLKRLGVKLKRWSIDGTRYSLNIYNLVYFLEKTAKANIPSKAFFGRLAMNGLFSLTSYGLKKLNK